MSAETLNLVGSEVSTFKVSLIAGSWALSTSRDNERRVLTAE